MKKIIMQLAMLLAMLPSCSANNEDTDKTDDNDTTTYEFTTEDLWTQHGDKKIYGKLYTPEGKTGKLPLVIFSHGFGGSHNDLASYAERMAHRGYMAYTFDFCGGSNYSRSDGSTAEMSVLTERADLEAIIDYFKTRSDIDPSKITLAGASQGGFVSALTAANRPDDICSLVLFYPALCIVDDAHSRWDSYESITSSNLWGTHLGAIYYQDAWNIDVYDEISKYHGPVLLVHGTSDNIVNISYADRAAQTYSDIEYHKLQGAGHGFSGSNRTTSINYMESFMKAHTDNSSHNSNANKVTVTINGKTFTATLAENKTAEAFTALLPMTLNMTELNGNEKYNYLDSNLPTDASNPETINTGDIMLYGSNCIVLFYKTFNTSYRYTRIGHIDDVEGLAEAVGSGNVSVVFGSQSSAINSTQASAKHNDDAYYNLLGMRVDNPEKGIYIHGGKKIKI